MHDKSHNKLTLNAPSHTTHHPPPTPHPRPQEKQKTVEWTSLVRILFANQRYVAHFSKIDEHSVIYFIQPYELLDDRPWALKIVRRFLEPRIMDWLIMYQDCGTTRTHPCLQRQHSWAIKYNITHNLIEEHQIWLPWQSEYYVQHQNVMQLVQQEKLDPVQCSCNQITEWFLASFGHLLKGYFQWNN